MQQMLVQDAEEVGSATLDMVEPNTSGIYTVEPVDI